MKDKSIKYRLDRKVRYPDGYLPKIQYWQYKMNKAIEQGDARGIAYASDRLVYFVGRQYGVPQVKSV